MKKYILAAAIVLGVLAASVKPSKAQVYYEGYGYGTAAAGIFAGAILGGIISGTINQPYYGYPYGYSYPAPVPYYNPPVVIQRRVIVEDDFWGW